MHRQSPGTIAASSTEPRLGVHLLLADGRHGWPIECWADHLRYARQAVGEWGYVLGLVQLSDLTPGQRSGLDRRSGIDRWQYFMDLCRDLRLTPVLRLATIYDPARGWLAPPRDDDATYRTVARRYADLIGALSWPTSAHYVIVGNEPNRGDEWGGRPDPAAYARFLIDVADALHEVDPRARVLNAGLDAYAPHTGSQPLADGRYYVDQETFLDEMFAAHPEAFARIDVWASHAYPLGAFIQGPWEQRYQVDWVHDAANPHHVEPEPGVNNRGINGYEWELFKLASLGVPALPVMITETGWRHSESVDSRSPDNGRPLPAAETVARYLDLALEGNGGRYPDLPEDGWTPWLDDPRVIGVILFALDGHPVLWAHTNLLQVDEQGSILGTYPPFDLLVAKSAPG